MMQPTNTVHRAQCMQYKDCDDDSALCKLAPPISNLTPPTAPRRLIAFIRSPSPIPLIRPRPFWVPPLASWEAPITSCLWGSASRERGQSNIRSLVSPRLKTATTGADQATEVSVHSFYFARSHILLIYGVVFICVLEKTQVNRP